MISKNDSSKLSLSHNKTCLNQASKNNQTTLKQAKHTCLHGLITNRVKTIKSKQKIKDYVSPSKNDSVGGVSNSLHSSMNPQVYGLKIEQDGEVYVCNRRLKGHSIIINTCRETMQTSVKYYIHAINIFFWPNLAQKNGYTVVKQRPPSRFCVYLCFLLHNKGMFDDLTSYTYYNIKIHQKYTIIAMFSLYTPLFRVKRRDYTPTAITQALQCIHTLYTPLIYPHITLKQSDTNYKIVTYTYNQMYNKIINPIIIKYNQSCSLNHSLSTHTSGLKGDYLNNTSSAIIKITKMKKYISLLKYCFRLSLVQNHENTIIYIHINIYNIHLHKLYHQFYYISLF